jgi:hypothetical protein
MQFNRPLMSGALFICTDCTCKGLRIVYWDNTGLAMWNKRFEKDPFRGSRRAQPSKSLSVQQRNSLLGGFDIYGHKLSFMPLQAYNIRS